MKAKFISALILTGILGTTVSITNAQSASAAPKIQMQDGVPNIPGVEFTDEQKEQLKEIHEESSSRIKEILTSSQQDYLKNAVELGRKPEDVIKSLNLSRQQREQLQEIQFEQRQELFKILTNEQRQQLMKTMRRRRPA